MRRTNHMSAKFLIAIATGIAMFVSLGGKASATHMNIPGTMPANIRAYFDQTCGHSGQSPAVAQWVSAAGAAATTTINVPYGAPSVNLQLNFSGIVCYPNSAVPETRLGVMASSASPPGTVSGINGAVLRLYWGSAYQSVGAYRTDANAFAYAPTGGFRTSGTYVITLDNRVINRFASGVYGCVASGGGNPGGWNYSRCPRDLPRFGIRINVAPRPVDAGSCSVGVSSTSLYPGQAFTASFTARNQGQNGGFAWSVNSGIPQRYRLEYSGNMPGAGRQEIRGPGVTQTGFGPILYVGRSTSWTQGYTAPSALGIYTLRWRIYGYNGLDGYHYVGSTCTQTVTVAERPYMRSYGGDIQAGASFGDSCPKGPARIIGINNGRNPYTGAGTQLAAFAMGQINDFATGQRWSSSTPNFLSFARSGAGGNYNATYGGGLGAGHAQCIPDYFAAYPGNGTDPGATLNINPASDVTYYRDGNLTLTQAAFTGLDEGEDMSVYVDGNVFIRDSIVYRDTSSYANPTEVPSFKLIVRGNIFVAPGVSRLDGLYVAQPSTNSLSENGGRFYTCGFGFRAPTTAELVSTCRTRLTVYGAVVANILKLTRTAGSANNSTPAEFFDPVSGAPIGGNPAEMFIYSPEMWLKEGLSGGDGFDAVVPLPPVL